MGPHAARALRAWLAVLLCIAVIWTLSGEAFSGRETQHTVASLLRWLFGEIDRQTLRHANYLIRKFGHLLEYGVLAVLAFRALRLSIDVSLGRVVAFALALVLTVAGADELRQSMLPTRTGSVADVALNLTGGMLGVALIVAFHRWLGVGWPASGDRS